MHRAPTLLLGTVKFRKKQGVHTFIATLFQILQAYGSTNVKFISRISDPLT